MGISTFEHWPLIGCFSPCDTGMYFVRDVHLRLQGDLRAIAYWNLPNYASVFGTCQFVAAVSLWTTTS